MLPSNLCQLNTFNYSGKEFCKLSPVVSLHAVHAIFDSDAVIFRTIRSTLKQLFSVRQLLSANLKRRQQKCSRFAPVMDWNQRKKWVIALNKSKAPPLRKTSLTIFKVT
ncbi:CLUMA_CG002825, isoform A [Clunio marinus]|uniref:CLUMA_CG002825, isoform A n=1 Tax=Clunio marinus TaxID=568069 RepID=A0A1J1HLD5_9DIPT|nr:CLUMA_CG002825, isoform A [Clunio marinus]